MASTLVFHPLQTPFTSFTPPSQRKHTLRTSLVINFHKVRSTSPEQPNQHPNNLTPEDEDVKDFGVRTALSMLIFYKREISPLLPASCRYVPTCSEYSMEAYKKYGVAKGTVLTAWRLCRCNPLGGYGFDPPRWFDEGKSSDQ